MDATGLFIEPEVGTSHTVDIVEQGIEKTVSRFMVKGEMMDIKYMSSPTGAVFVSCLVYNSIKQRCDPDRTRGNTNAVRSDKYPNHTLEVPRYENFQRDMSKYIQSQEPKKTPTSNVVLCWFEKKPSRAAVPTSGDGKFVLLLLQNFILDHTSSHICLSFYHTRSTIQSIGERKS